MSLTLIALAAAAATPSATHSVQIDHGGTAVEATYNARAEFRTKTVGAKTPNRMDGQRCNWTATILVDRSLNNGPALSRTIATDQQFSGSKHGACTAGREPVSRALAQHEGKIRDSVIAVAEADRAPLLAELDAVRKLASN